jgi:all-trans-retinol 13,14-reductase
MRTFLTVKVALLPLAAFVLLTMAGQFAAGAWTGFGLAAALAVLRWRAGQIMQMEIGILVFLGAAALIGGRFGIGSTTQWMAAMQVMLALVSAFSIARGKPWTADYARAAFSAAASTPVFHKVNRTLTAMWGFLFGCFAVLEIIRAPGWTIGVLVGIGALASIAGPKRLVRRHAMRLLKTDRFDWRPPAIRPPDGKVDADVAIVGAGIGGLAAAALLARAGARVQVFERHVVAGGACHDFLRKTRHDGAPRLFRFDAGVHDISGVRPGGPVTSLLDRVGAPSLEWLRLDHRIVRDGHVFDVPRDPADYVRALQAMFPASADGIGELFADIREVFDAMYANTRCGIPGPPRDVAALLAFPQRFPLAVAWMNRPFVEFVHRRIADDGVMAHLLRLSHYIGDDAAALRVRDVVPLFGYVFFGGYYPRGGSGRLADSLVAAIERDGGAVHLKTPVAKITLTKGVASGLKLADGRDIRASAVIANGDLRKTFHDLVGRDQLPPNFATGLDAVPRCSAASVHLGLKCRPSGPPLVHVNGSAGGAGIVMPSVVDEGAAPSGYATMEITRLVTQEEARTWFPADGDLDAARHTDAYRTRKQALGDDLIRRAMQAFPDLQDRIVYRCDASPVTYARYQNSTLGSIYGVDGFDGCGAKSPIPGLVLAGAATHGPGIEAVMMSGARAAEALLPGVLDDAGSR